MSDALCTARRGKNVSARAEGHTGPHRAEIRWDSRKNPKTASELVAFIRQRGELHLHLPKGATNVWCLVTSPKPRPVCADKARCLKVPLTGGGGQ